MHFIIYTQLSHKHWTCAFSSELKVISATHCENLYSVTTLLDNFSKILILTMYKILLSKFLFHKSFTIFMDPNKFFLYFPLQKQTTVGQNYYHFSLTKIFPFFIPSLHWHHTCPTCFTHWNVFLVIFSSFNYIWQFLTFKSLNKTKK